MPPGNSEQTTLFGGRLALAQPARGEGYRVNVDALLLARHAAIFGMATHAADLGAGVGAVGLALLLLGGAGRVTLVERDPAAAALLRANAAPYADRTRAVESDVRDIALHDVDTVLCNPPYTPPGAGKAAPVPARDAARRGDLDAFLEATSSVRPAAAHFVYPASQLGAFVERAARHGLAPRVLRLVHAHEDGEARVAIVTLSHAAVEAVVEVPWFERRGAEPDPGLASFLRGADLA